MNKIFITGRITRDPELKTTNSGTEVCNFDVAVDRRRKDADGNKVTDFFPCSAWGKSGVFVNTYFHKGDGINIEGRMEARKYVDKDGNNRTAWGLQCDNVEFPHGKGKNGGSETSTGSAFEELPDDDGGSLPF